MRSISRSARKLGVYDDALPVLTLCSEGLALCAFRTIGTGSTPVCKRLGCHGLVAQ